MTDEQYLTQTMSDPTLALFTIMLMGVVFFISIIAYVINSFLMAKVFTKLNEPAWKAWVPVYNYWIFLEYGGFKGAWSLLSIAGIIVLPFMLVPVVGAMLPFLTQFVSLALTVLTVIASVNVGKGFGKEPVWCLLFLFLSPVWFGIIGFDRSTYNPALNLRSLRGNNFQYSPPTV